MKTKSLGPAALLCVSLILVPAAAFVDGTSSGVVINGLTGDPVRGDTLTVEGTDISFKTGVAGLFRAAVPAGASIVIGSIDWSDAMRVKDVVVVKEGGHDLRWRRQAEEVKRTRERMRPKSAKK